MVWYYRGLIDGQHDWVALRDVYETYTRLDLVPTDYLQAQLWKSSCMPAFERQLATMFGTDQK